MFGILTRPNRTNFSCEGLRVCAACLNRLSSLESRSLTGHRDDGQLAGSDPFAARTKLEDRWACLALLRLKSTQKWERFWFAKFGFILDEDNLSFDKHKISFFSYYEMTFPEDKPAINGSDKPSTEVPADVQYQNGHNSGGAKIDYYKSMLEKLKRTGKALRADVNQPDISIKPAWLDEDLFRNAGSVYERHFMGMNFAHLSGLLLLVRVDSIYKTLSATGESDSVSKLFKRYYHTVKHIKTWYEGDIFEKNSDAYRSLLIVRGMHNKVSSKLNDEARSRPIENGRVQNANETSKLVAKQESGDKGLHISEYDVMITQFAFIGFIVTNPNKMGLIDNFSARDLDSLLHFWRIVGYYLGASDELNLCSYKRDDVIGLCNAITEIEYKSSIMKNRLHEPPGIMSVNIVRSIKFIPMLTVYGIMRHLCEILGIETREIEGRRTWYSNLSYTLIKLVMTRLLGYKHLRSFNNGLTRLSLLLVGKIEDLFAGHLSSKYGNGLKI